MFRWVFAQRHGEPEVPSEKVAKPTDAQPTNLQKKERRRLGAAGQEVESRPPTSHVALLRTTGFSEASRKTPLNDLARNSTIGSRIDERRTLSSFAGPNPTFEPPRVV